MAMNYVFDPLPANGTSVLVNIPQYPFIEIPCTYISLKKQFEIVANGALIELRDIVYWKPV